MSFFRFTSPHWFGLLGALALAAFPTESRADLGSLGTTTVGVAIAGGIQPDTRSCTVGGQDRTFPGTGSCLLWGGGIEAMMLWRGRVGAALGLYSIAGQAAVPVADSPSGQAPPAFPDRVSVPLLLDVRPLAFVAAQDGSYSSRFLHGLRLGLGPSFELVRTSSDSSIAFGNRIGELARSILGMHASLDLEVPLIASIPSALSLRFSTRILYVPLIPLNSGVVRSAPFDAGPGGGPPVGSEYVGYGVRGQLFLGLAYYL